MIDYYEPNLDLTLMGCGFLGGYHLGAICLLEQIWPQKPFNRICGSSCGGLLGALVVVGVSLKQVFHESMCLLGQLRSFLWRPTQFVSISTLVERKLEQLLPQNGHQLCNGRLGVSITNQRSWKNEFIFQFNSRRELIDAVVAGCFIPLWSGSLTYPTFRGQQYIDGAYSDNLPKFRLTAQEKQLGLKQIEVCPFAGDTDVSPPDKYGLFKFQIVGTRYFLNLNNIKRSYHAMLPFPNSYYRDYLLAGHRDMKDYVLSNKLVKCRACHKNETQSYGRASTRQCLACLKLFEQVDSLKVPSSLMDTVR